MTGSPVNFEPNPPGPAGPRPTALLSPINMNNLALYQSGGARRLFMEETFGYSTLDVTSPMSPSVMRWDYLPFDANKVPIGGDGQSYVASIAASPDGQRVALSLNGPGTPPNNTVIGSPDLNYGFVMWGDTVPANSTVVIQQLGGRYLLYLASIGAVWAADITTLPTTFSPENVASELAPWPGSLRPQLASGFLVYAGADYASVVVVDVSSPGPAGAILAGMPSATLSAAALGGGNIYAAKAAVDASDPRRLWLLVEFAIAAGQTAPSYGLYSVTEGADGTFAAPVAIGTRLQLPGAQGETWGYSGNASALLALGGTVQVLAWGVRLRPSYQAVLYSSTTSSWPSVEASPVTATGFGLNTDMGLLPDPSGTLYAFIANGNNAWTLPLSCGSDGGTAPGLDAGAPAADASSAGSDGGTVPGLDAGAPAPDAGRAGRDAARAIADASRAASADAAATSADASSPADAAASHADGASPTAADGAMEELLSSGCGCSASAPAPLLSTLLALGAAWLRARRRD